MQKQKKIMLLGGLRYLLPVIEAAHKHGIYVITCDYLPDNIAHKYSDEYVNVSIVDKEAVLAVAKEKQIDGIMSFAVDPGVITAAYVQDKMGLPGNPYESVCILQQKDKFRQFMRDNGFNVPFFKGYASLQDALADSASFPYPMIAKPVDSAGSKGVTVVATQADLEKSFNYAMSYSIRKRVILEEFIDKAGCSTDSDSFSIDGKLAFVSFSAQRFDEGAANPYAPAAFSWPSTMTPEQEKELTSELQRLISLLHMKNSVYNVEARVNTKGKVYIMEVSPRGGGNRLAEMVRFATGEDMITAGVLAAVGETPVIQQKPYDGCWAEVILHSSKSGTFSGIQVVPSIQDYVRELDLWVKPGDKIEEFISASQTIGTMVLKFPDTKTLESALKKASSLYNVEVK